MNAERQEVQARIEEYSLFVRDVLRPDFEVASKAEMEVRGEIEDYENLGSQLEQLKPNHSINPLVDLGHQLAFCKAQADSSSMVYVHTGMGFHVEMEIVEAIAFVEKRVKFLTHDVLRLRSSKTGKVREHLAVAQNILDQLASELDKL